MNMTRAPLRLTIIDIDDTDAGLLRELMTVLLSRTPAPSSPGVPPVTLPQSSPGVPPVTPAQGSGMGGRPMILAQTGAVVAPMIPPQSSPGVSPVTAAQSGMGGSPMIPQSAAAFSQPEASPGEAPHSGPQTTGGPPVPHSLPPRRRTLTCDERPGQSFTARAAADLAGCAPKQLYDALRRSSGRINGFTFHWSDTIAPAAPQLTPTPADPHEARPRHAGSSSMPLNPHVQSPAARIAAPRDDGRLADEENEDRDNDEPQLGDDDEDDDDNASDDD